MWGFPQVKALAVREMDRIPIPPVDRAVMARAFEVDPARQWLETAYTELSTREQPLTREEGERLGLDVVLHLAEVRERIRSQRVRSSEKIRSSHSTSASVSHQWERREARRQRASANEIAGWRSQQEHAMEVRSPSPVKSQLSYSSRAHESCETNPPNESCETSSMRSGYAQNPELVYSQSAHSSGMAPSEPFTEEEVEHLRARVHAQNPELEA
jgi:hypothetical protein